MGSGRGSGDTREGDAGRTRGVSWRDRPGLPHERNLHRPERIPDAIQRPRLKEQVKHLLRDDRSDVVTHTGGVRQPLTMVVALRVRQHNAQDHCRRARNWPSAGLRLGRRVRRRMSTEPPADDIAWSQAFLAEAQRRCIYGQVDELREFLPQIASDPALRTLRPVEAVGY